MSYWFLTCNSQILREFVDLSCRGVESSHNNYGFCLWKFISDRSTIISVKFGS